MLPLRSRAADLPKLLQYFLGQINDELGIGVNRVEDDAMQRLAAHNWPGNARELKNALTKAAMDSRGPVLLAEAVGEALATSEPAPKASLKLGTLE